MDFLRRCAVQHRNRVLIFDSESIKMIPVIIQVGVQWEYFWKMLLDYNFDSTIIAFACILKHRIDDGTVRHSRPDPADGAIGIAMI